MLQSTERILPINIGMALKSLRNSDFDVYSAVCEVIDNSLEADAKEIKIKIESAVPPGKRKPRPTMIAFGDDGHGMDPETLQMCLKLGYSKRYDNRKGIGRFGVGMTFGAISLCQKIEVYSRQKRGNWYYTFLDISNINKDVEPTLHPIEQRDLPKDYENLVGDFGTLVIWSKIDRIESEFDLEELKHKIGRIYRKFIGEQIISNKKITENPNPRKIFINDEVVSLHDPLFVIKNSKFPEDETTKIEDEYTFPWPVHSVDAPTSGEKMGKITIRTSLLPESWRKIRLYGTKSTDNNRRKVNENEGFSILRNGREVFYGDIPNFSPKIENMDRFWGCEIDFEPVLDYWFSVRNIKIGARPLKELREELQKKLQGTIVHNFREKIRERWSKTEQEEQKTNVGPVLGHKEKEKELQGIVPPLASSIPEGEINKNIKKHAKEIFDDPEEQKKYEDELSDPTIAFKFIEDYKARPNGPFIDVIDNVGKKVVHYNMNHPFFLEVYGNISEIKKIAKTSNPDSDKLVKVSDKMKSDLDSLIYAYAEGIYDLDDLSRSQTVNETIDEHMYKWSFHLRKTYK